MQPKLHNKNKFKNKNILKKKLNKKKKRLHREGSGPPNSPRENDETDQPRTWGTTTFNEESHHGPFSSSKIPHPCWMGHFQEHKSQGLRTCCHYIWQRRWGPALSFSRAPFAPIVGIGLSSFHGQSATERLHV